MKRDCNLKDVEYVKKLLAGDYPTEKTKEIPYPSFQELISSTSFDYLNGTVEGEVPNGPRSREGHPYLWFRHIDKSILSHRFIASVTLEKWIPRDCDVDHINHNPSDNRPSNLRIVTKRDNAGNRRKALLSDLANIDQVAKAFAELKASLEVNQEHQRDPAPNIDATDELFWPSTGTPSLSKDYTVKTKPGTTSGTFFETKQGSWHFYPDGQTPDADNAELEDIPW